MKRARVGIATCELALSHDEDQHATLEALYSRGIDASLVLWDDPGVAWWNFDLVIVRSAWDYPEKRASFLDWAARIEPLANPFDVIEWNTDKRYLAGLSAKGFATVPTTWIEPGSGIELPEGELVVKPGVGTGARGSGRYGANDADAAARHAERLLNQGHVVMAQPYLEGFEQRGEHGLIYLGDRYSHAICKPPLLSQRGPFVAGALTQAIVEAVTPTDAEREFAEAVLDSVPGGRDRLLYARIDTVPGDGGAPVLVELEVTEPRLFFRHGPGSPGRFASAVEEWLARA